MKPLIAAIIAFTVASAPVLAHEEFRVVGEITKSQAARLEVKMRDGKIASVGIDQQTKVTRDKAPADAKELKAGQFVVINAYGDNFDDLLAMDVQLVPPIAPAKK